MHPLLVRDGPAAGATTADQHRAATGASIDEDPQVRLWERMLCKTRQPLRREAAEIDPEDVNAIERLRRDWPAQLVTSALDLARARRKATEKFPHAEEIVSDVAGIEQATSARVAEHKAQRFAAAISGGLAEGLSGDLAGGLAGDLAGGPSGDLAGGPSGDLAGGPSGGRIVDLCCGIGGDAMSLMRIAEVIAIDISPLRAWMARRNAACRALAADVETLSLEGELFHLDPARRDDVASASAGDPRRFWRYEDYRPGPAFIDRLLTTCPNGAIKLGPGVDLEALPTAPSGGGDREIEIINEGGTLVQAVLWCGKLALHPGQRTATRLPEGLSFTATPQAAPVMEGGVREAFDRFLYVPDPAIERADLLGALCRDLPVREAHPGLGILTSAGHVQNPWLSAFEILAQLPWRPRKISQWLSAHDGGIVQVKTRGRAVDTDAVQRDLRGNGHEPYTIFALRLGRKITAIITRPVSG